MLVTVCKLRLHYENIDNVYIQRKMHEKMKDKNEDMEDHLRMGNG